MDNLHLQFPAEICPILYRTWQSPNVNGILNQFYPW